MPHFGLLDEDKQFTAEYNLQRARIHVRSARRQTSEGKFQSATAVWYDAMMFGCLWYVQTNFPNMVEDYQNETEVYQFISDKALLEEELNPFEIQKTMEDGIDRIMNVIEMQKYIRQIEKILSKFGVIPFDLSTIPDEPAGIY